MKNKLYFAILFFISSLLVPFGLDLSASGINQKKSKIELIEYTSCLGNLPIIV